MQLPVLNRPIDNTAQSAYMACPREYLFGMHLHRRERERKMALSFGSLWHKILEVLYKTGGDIIAVEQEAERIWDGNTEGDYRTLQRALMDLPKYVKRWGLAKDLAETVGFPDNPMVELTAQALIPGTDHPYAGKIDRIIVNEHGHGYVEDHKTTSRLDKHYFSQFELSNQMMGYTALGRKLAPGIQIKGVRINVYHVLKNESNFHRREVPFSDSKMQEWRDNYNRWTARLRMDVWAWELQQGADPDELGIDSTLVDFLRNWAPFPAHFGDNGCSRKFGLCTYHGVCSLPQRVHMKALEHDFDYKPWNPLEVEDEDEGSNN